MNNEENLLAKFYRGECTRDEIERLLNKIREGEDADDLEIMAQLWEALRDFPQLEEPQAHRIVKRTLDKIEKNETGPLSSNPKNSGRRVGKGQYGKWRIAAAAVLLLAVAAWMWMRSSPTPLEFRTAFGEQRTITLPDQSQVKLNANSTIRYHADWTSAAVRQVWLEGEAYFQVQKDVENARKFRVITRDLTVEVMGTVFNVNTRQAATEVFLEEGKVNVDLEETEEDIMMDPGELVTYSVKTHRSQKRKIVQEEAPASWKDGTIILQDSPLLKIIEKLEEIHGITVKVENRALLEKRYTYHMPVNNLDTAILIMEASIGQPLERTDGTLIIK